MAFPRSIRQIAAGSRGVTLVELILVIVLLAVVSVSVLPQLFDTTAISIEGATAMIAADIRYTQELAMSVHSSKTIVFTTNDSYYTVDSQTVNLPSKVTVSSGATFAFNSLGEPTTGGGSSVQVTAGSSCKELTVENYTGQVSSSSCP